MDVSHDVGIVVFPAKHDRKIVRLGPTPSRDDSLTLVGYGFQEQDLERPSLAPKSGTDYTAYLEKARSNTRKKKVGTNAVEWVDDGAILVQPGSEAPGDSARAAGGDSGGTLFDGQGRAVGILSGIVSLSLVDFYKVASEGSAVLGSAKTAYADLNLPNIQAFLREVTPRVGGTWPSGDGVEFSESEGESHEEHTEQDPDRPGFACRPAH